MLFWIKSAIIKATAKAPKNPARKILTSIIFSAPYKIAVNGIKTQGIKAIAKAIVKIKILLMFFNSFIVFNCLYITIYKIKVNKKINIEVDFF